MNWLSEQLAGKIGIFVSNHVENKKYQLIVADPPWDIQKIKKRVRPNQVNMDYPMMSLDEIEKLPIEFLADENCICFIWTIDKYLYQTPRILRAWGFKYHLTMAWDKTNGLAMYGFNRQTEFIVVGLKGKNEAYPKRKTIRTSFTAKSTFHSAKPDEFYEMLNVLPYNPRIDLFARKKRDGWDVWGNEIESDISL